MRYAAVCPNCNQWQHAEIGGDCVHERVKAGLAVRPNMVNVKGRENELCRHDVLLLGGDYANLGSRVLYRQPDQSRICSQCGNVLELVNETAH